MSPARRTNAERLEELLAKIPRGDTGELLVVADLRAYFVMLDARIQHQREQIDRLTYEDHMGR